MRVRMRRLAPFLVILGGPLVAVAGCNQATPASSAETTPPAPAAPTTAAAAPTRPLMGVAINAHHISDLPAYLEGVDSIAALGANTLLLVTPWFQDTVDASEVRSVPDRCPTDEQLIAILQRAETHGLDTTLLPIVLIENPGEKDWRGLIQPDDWTTWWASYDRFTDHFLDIAAAGGVDVYVVGSELNSTEHDIERWRRIVEHVRARFPGRLTYSANWDRYEKVPFWDLVDHMSVSSYFELVRNDPDASVHRLVKAWGRERDRLLGHARRVQRPLVLMEVGYPSVPWATAHPWNYVAPEGTPADVDAQARGYRAFFEAWTPAFRDPDSDALGFNCYAWDPYKHGEANDTGYGLRGKPAMEIVREGFALIRADG